MKRFGFLNGCYWMLLDTLEDVMSQMSPEFLSLNSDYIIDSLIAGKVIAINEAGGFHAGKLNDYTQHISQNSPRYPSQMDRVAVMRKELDTELDKICAELGMSRDEVMNYQSEAA